MRPFLSLASPGGARGRLSVLVLHRVFPAPDPLFLEAMHASRFSELCQWLKSMFSVLPLDEAVRHMSKGSLPERALSITFDDGYADNRLVAMPVLQKFGLSATVFVSTGFLDGGCMWNDIVIETFRRTAHAECDTQGLLGPDVGRLPLTTTTQRRTALEAVIANVKYLGADTRLTLVQELARRLSVAVPTDLMMSSAQVREMHRAGIQIGAHTVSHPILAKLTRDAARQEMLGSKQFLEDLLGERVSVFAYPNGKPGEDFNADHVALARELGFEAAVTTARGASTAATDPFQIPRFTPWDRSRLRFGARILSTLWTSRRGMPPLAATLHSDKGSEVAAATFPHCAPGDPKCLKLG